MYQTRFHQREETIESRVNDVRMRKDIGKGVVNEDRAAGSSSRDNGLAMQDECHKGKT